MRTILKIIIIGSIPAVLVCIEAIFWWGINDDGTWLRTFFWEYKRIK